MSPARRRKSRRTKKKKENNKKVLHKVIFWLSIALIVFLLFKLTTRHWSSNSKLTIVSPQKEGSIQISTFNPSSDTIRTIIIPAETEVRVARQLGTWRIKSVWELGENENLSGQLLAETVTKQFNIPVYLWGDVGASGFSSPNAPQILKSAISPYKTNLGIGDRLRLAAFSLGVKNFKREEGSLSETKVLERTILVDGTAGYKVVGEIPSSIAAIYSDPHAAATSAKTQIIDATTSPTIAKEVGEIVEVVGLKVASIENIDVNEDVDCEVSGMDKDLTKKVAYLFSCEVVMHEDDNFDLTILLGEDFVKRF
jgi:hypothetical protein